jgi:hypothetical protein
VHDVRVDSTGLNRDSDGRTIKGGSTFELSALLKGEVAAGYLWRNYKDPQLQSLGGFIADGSLIWTATPLTTVTLTARSTVNETILPGVSGILSRDFSAQLDHSFRRWLIGTLKFAFGTDDFVGSNRLDRRYEAVAGLTYKASRHVQLKGEVRREWRLSNFPGADYTANVVFGGLRLQY